MVKFIFFSFIFHLTFLTLFKLDIVDLKKNKEQTVAVNLSLEKKNIEKKEKPKKEAKPKKTIQEKTKKKVKPEKIVQEKPKKAVKPKKTVQENEKPRKLKEEKFDDLLKDLAKEKLPLDKNDNFEKKLQKLSEKKLQNSSNLNKKKYIQNELKAIEKLILNQIDENWSRPPGIKISKNLVIKMIVRLDINGAVIGLQIQKNTLNEVNKDNTLRPYLDSAIRAIKKASPFEGLKKDRYNNWKELIINFKPIETR